jgi:hypothetical protein
MSHVIILVYDFPYQVDDVGTMLGADYNKINSLLRSNLDFSCKRGCRGQLGPPYIILYLDFHIYEFINIAYSEMMLSHLNT